VLKLKSKSVRKREPLHLAFGFGVSAQTIIYVTPTGTGDGSSWANATNLENAVISTTFGTQIWVRQGTYLPLKIVEVPSCVKVFGGFAGTETQLSQRNFINNPTIIDAQRKFGPVVFLNRFSTIDGFTVRDGAGNTNDYDGGFDGSRFILLVVNR
jgi:hypothetical protein